MIEYIIAENPDDRILKRASDLLKSGALICLPTDTSWIVVADPYNRNGVDKLYRFKKVDKIKHFSLLCSSFSKASEVAVIHDSVFRLLKKKIPGHYTFIFEATKRITKVLKASKTDKEVGLRFVPSNLIEKLLEVHGDVVVSSNLDLDMLSVESSEDIYSYMIEEKLGNHLAMIIDPGEYEFVGQSTIVDLTEDVPTIVREGAGQF